MTERLKFGIKHPVLGAYDQTVFDTPKEAGHNALASNGRYGWEMPTEPATERLISQTSGKIVLEIGCGLGNIAAIPSLTAGAKEFYATDITPEHLNDSSILRKNSKEMGTSNRLHTQLIPESWWSSDLLSNPTVRGLFSIPDSSNPQLPENVSVDLLIARHVIQFGTYETVLRVFDLASAALKKGGTFSSINFTPFTGYIYRNRGPETIRQIYELNLQFAQGIIDRPGGYLSRKNGILKVNLGDLTGIKDLMKGDDDIFTYIDAPTLRGILRIWSNTRMERGLPIDLVISEGFYFSPSSIAEFNKLSGSKELEEKENYCFTLTKI